MSSKGWLLSTHFFLQCGWIAVQRLHPGQYSLSSACVPMLRFEFPATLFALKYVASAVAALFQLPPASRRGICGLCNPPNLSMRPL